MAVADKLKELRIKANVIADKTIGFFEINIDVHDGIATLVGEVENEEQKHRAEELSYEIEGILEVQNDIQVVPESLNLLTGCSQVVDRLGYGTMEGTRGDSPISASGQYSAPGPGFATSEQFPGEFTDEEIMKEVQHRLVELTEMDISHLKFTVNNQIVQINGTVSSSDEANQLQDIIMNLRGVMGICGVVTVKDNEK